MAASNRYCRRDDARREPVNHNPSLPLEGRSTAEDERARLTAWLLDCPVEVPFEALIDCRNLLLEAARLRGGAR